LEKVTSAGQCNAGSDVPIGEDWGATLGQFVGQSAGCPGGLWGDGSCHASAAECDEGDVSLGVGVGGCNQGDGKDGRGGVQLVISLIKL